MFHFVHNCTLTILMTSYVFKMNYFTIKLPYFMAYSTLPNQWHPCLCNQKISLFRMRYRKIEKFLRTKVQSPSIFHFLNHLNLLTTLPYLISFLITKRCWLPETIEWIYLIFFIFFKRYPRQRNNKLTHWGTNNCIDS